MMFFHGEMVFPLFVFIMIFCQCFRFSIAGNCGGKAIVHTITVARSGQFKTVQSAIDSIKSNNAQWVKIHIDPGKYIEKVQIPRDKPCIFLEGEGRGVTTITYNDHQQTDTSATFSSFPNNIVAAGISFENTLDLSDKSELDQIVSGKEVIGPALAARIYGDKSAFFDCGFLGFQDTLWDVQGRHYYKNCYIQGAVDFIFGNGQSYFENCHMNAMLTTSKAQVSYGYVTAQGRSSKNDPSGFVFRGGKVVGSGPVFLGRAYGPYSRVIFHGTFLDSVVSPQGWDAWHHTQNVGNLMYVEVNCTGQGANRNKRVHWEMNISPNQINQFSKSSFINQDQWLASIPH